MELPIETTHAHTHTHTQHTPAHTHEANQQRLPSQQRLPIPSGPFFSPSLSTVSSRMPCVDRHHSLTVDLVVVVVVRIVGLFWSADIAIVVLQKGDTETKSTS